MNLEIMKIHSGKATTYKVKCLECGNIYHTGHATLNKKKNGNGIPRCHLCFNTDLKSRKKFTMCTENISLTFYKIIERQAKLRGIEFNVTPEYLESIYDGKCYLSGIPIKIGTHSTVKKVMDLGTASLDRINSDKGYVEGNVGWCFKEINMMKYDLTHENFVDICKKIAEHNK